MYNLRCLTQRVLESRRTGSLGCFLLRSVCQFSVLQSLSTSLVSLSLFPPIFWHYIEISTRFKLAKNTERLQRLEKQVDLLEQMVETAQKGKESGLLCLLSLIHILFTWFYCILETDEIRINRVDLCLFLYVIYCFLIYYVHYFLAYVLHLDECL